jgi:hypothetical protein
VCCPEGSQTGKGFSLVRDWSHCGIDERLAMLPKIGTTFLDDKVVLAETPFNFVTESMMLVVIMRILAEEYVAELTSEILLMKR